MIADIISSHRTESSPTMTSRLPTHTHTHTLRAGNDTIGPRLLVDSMGGRGWFGKNLVPDGLCADIL